MKRNTEVINHMRNSIKEYRTILVKISNEISHLDSGSNEPVFTSEEESLLEQANDKIIDARILLGQLLDVLFVASA